MEPALKDNWLRLLFNRSEVRLKGNDDSFTWMCANWLLAKFNERTKSALLFSEYQFANCNEANHIFAVIILQASEILNLGKFRRITRLRFATRK